MSNNPGDQNITITYVAETSDAIEKVKKLREEQERIKASLLAMKKEVGGSYKELGSALRDTLKDSIGEDAKKKLSVQAVSGAVQQLTAQEKRLADETKRSNEEGKKGQTIWQQYGRAVIYALGLSLYSIISNTINWVKQLIQTAVEYGQALTMLAVSTRALQRVGSDITFKEVIQEVKDLKAMFPIFTTKEAVEAVGFTQLVTRNFQFTREEMKKTTEIAAGLSVLLGKDLQTASRELALFLSSGYAESMQRAGFAVNRLTVVEEAHRLGINKSYMAMTEVERAHAALSLISRQFETVQADVNEVMKQQYQQLLITQKAWEEFTNNLALQFLPVISLVAKGIQTLTGLVAVLSNMLIASYKAIGKEAELALQSFANPKKFLEGQTKILTEFGTDFANAIKSFFPGGGNELKLPLGNYTGDIFAGLIGDAEQGSDQIQTVMDRMYQQIQSADEQFKSDMRKAEEDYWRDIYKIDQEESRKSIEQMIEHWRKEDEAYREFKRRQAELELEHTRKLEEIQANGKRDLDEVLLKYGQDRVDIINEYNKSVSEKNEENRKKELKSEEDFQNKLLKLREDFMLELEDAVRERDALAIMKMIRKYNLEKQQLEREHAETKVSNEEQAQQELDDLVQARDEKLAQLALELQRRKEELARQIAWEIEQEKLKYAQQQIDLQTHLDQQREDLDREYRLQREALATETAQRKEERTAQWEQQKIDMQVQFDERYQMFVNDLVRTEKLTSENLDAIAKLYEATYGKDGRVEAAIKNALMWTAAINGVSPSEFLNQTGYSFLNTPNDLLSNGGQGNAPSNPMNQINGPFTYIPSTFTYNPTVPGGGGGQSTPIQIELLLSPDLEANVINEVQNQIANVIIRTTQKNKR